MNAQQTRHNLIYLLPHVWVLDGHFITSTERDDACGNVDPAVKAMVLQGQHVISSPPPMVGGGILTAKGSFEWRGDTSSTAVTETAKTSSSSSSSSSSNIVSQSFLSVLSNQPPSHGKPLDVYRLKCLATYYEEEARRYRGLVTHQVMWWLSSS